MSNLFCSRQDVPTTRPRLMYLVPYRIIAGQVSNKANMMHPIHIYLDCEALNWLFHGLQIRLYLSIAMATKIAADALFMVKVANRDVLHNQGISIMNEYRMLNISNGNVVIQFNRSKAARNNINILDVLFRHLKKYIYRTIPLPGVPISINNEV